MKYWRPEFNFAWGEITDKDISRIFISPFHEFVIEKKDGERIFATQLKAK